ncbi:hypothetical protein [Lentzea sp. NPDC003310]|uniref:hypothetical protein n=1 Tax=Lentzea sp. NPDC003310 TaxID=3154447 RepID=UPI0033B6270E
MSDRWRRSVAVAVIAATGLVGPVAQANAAPGADQGRTITLVTGDRVVLTGSGPVLGGNGKWVTVLTHPKGVTSVSLRASARDIAGNSVTQTIVDAFLLR